jgi:hypothetical protein
MSTFICMDCGQRGITNPHEHDKVCPTPGEPVVPNGVAVPLGGGATLYVLPGTSDEDIRAFVEPFTGGTDMVVCPMPVDSRLVTP